MSSLDKIIQDEYEHLPDYLPSWDNLTSSIFDLLKEKASPEEYLKVEETVIECFVNMEQSTFVQGFIRGIAAVKGGAV